MGWGVLIGILVALLALWVALIALLWVLRPRNVALGELIRVVPDVLRLVRRLIGDRSTPFVVRVALVGLLLWLVNPIDLIPEFIPVLGPLDDVIVAVLVLRFVRGRLGAETLRARWPGTADGFALLGSVLGRER
jgi:uncharacterized membrane protein YkvA (DUF1232 family)